MRTPALLLAAVVVLAACANGRELGPPRPELENFRLAHNIVIDTQAQQGPLSRPAPPGAWQQAIQAEVARRLGRYQGDRLYHVAVHVDAYILAVPGIPLVASPRSALIIGVHVWDDELGRPLNDERRQFTVLESLSGESLLGSGLTQSAEQQIQNLARNAALAIENWLVEHPEWFPPRDPAAAPAAAPAAQPPHAPPPAAADPPPGGAAGLRPQHPVPVAEVQPGPG
jgi:hypothetical protein